MNPLFSSVCGDDPAQVNLRVPVARTPEWSLPPCPLTVQVGHRRAQACRNRQVLIVESLVRVERCDRYEPDISVFILYIIKYFVSFMIDNVMFSYFSLLFYI